MSENYGHLTHIESHEELRLYELIPNVVWIFDLDRHGWWWGNAAALKFWGLESLDQLVNKDLSGDTQGARERTLQTFLTAAREGLSIDPWTTYPGGKPKTLYMMHRAVTVGPERHRAIIAYINEEVNLGETPENLLLVEAMRYTTVLITSFTLEGEPIVENPAATAAYNKVRTGARPQGLSSFAARFADPQEGRACLAKALEDKGGRYTHLMNTDAGLRKHTLDIRMTRHPLTGDFLLLLAEYDVTPLHEALEAAEEAQEELHRLAKYDALTGLPNLRLFQEQGALLLTQAQRQKQQLAVMFIDLDGFKAVNDRLGHEAGDLLLKGVAERLQASLRDSDLVARIGGDEFIALQTNIHQAEDTARVAEKIIASLSQPFDLNGQPARIGASLGIALFPDHGEDMKALLKTADNLMYEVKRAGKNAYRIAGGNDPQYTVE